MSYERVKYYFEAGLWNAQMVKMAVRKGVITQAQYEAIIAGVEPESDVNAAIDEAVGILTGEVEA